jgi:hypothetical protein
MNDRYMKTAFVLGLLLVGSPALRAGQEDVEPVAKLPSRQLATLRPPVAPSMEGLRHETLRGLARHLDQTAQGALEGALDDARHGTSAEAGFIAPIRAFARGAHDLLTTIDSDPSTPSLLPARVADLGTAAAELAERIRAVGALENTYDDWEAVLDVLDRMKMLLAGGDVHVPAAHVVAALSGSSLQEFRQLARDLEASATRAHATAKADRSRYPDRGEQFLGELDYFAVQSRDLRLRADAREVNPQEIGPLVDRVLDDARQADRRMRDAGVFASVWDDSGRTIVILERMATLVRS